MKQKYTRLKIYILALALVSLLYANKLSNSTYSNTNSGVTHDNLASQEASKDNQTSNTKPSTVGSSSSISDSDVAIPSKLVDGVNQKRYFALSNPNDPYFATAWYLNSVNAPPAWATTTGSASVTVADIDTGFALSHQDLSSHWKLNSADPVDSVDNDSNGLVDDNKGWDFANGDSSPQAGATNPSGGGVSHGTETAGLIGAVGNNGVGTTAIAQNVSILPLQVLDDNGSGYSDDVASAITYAVDQGANVINMSLGTSGDDPVVRQAVDYAYNNNVVVVAAAGNCGNPGTSGPCSGQVTGYITFPASYNRVLAVGASTSTNARASFSSYGDRLDVVAPGSGTIVSPTWTSGNGTSVYATSLAGTSYASPIVASSVALVKAIRPSTSVDDIRALLMAGASKVSGMSGSFYSTSYGHGLLDVGNIVTVANELNGKTERVPALSQAGGVAAEHGYDSSDTIGSGCTTDIGLWCTVWFRDSSTNNERYLPYKKIGASGKVGWNFSSGVLGHGYWEARARDGGTVSDIPYTLFRK